MVSIELRSTAMNDPIKIDYLKKGVVQSRLISDEESAEHAMYTLTKYYIRDVFGPGTNMQLRQFLDDIIKDQMESFNE
jgi:hypothetical protein|tara:strand:- start:1371 stop:1604 length:234 start_codon:yes stop_codon:yes gene_type:complete